MPMNRAINLVCPHCSAITRRRPHPAPSRLSCGTCHRPFFTGLPPSLNAAAFSQHLHHDGVPLVVDFWAAWCGPSVSMAMHFEAATRALEPRARLVRVSIVEEPALAQSLHVTSIPLLAIFRHGKEVARHAGPMPAQQIVDWVRRHLER